MVQAIRDGGVDGLWKYIKEQFNNLKETVMNAIMDMIQSQVIQAGIKWILGLLSPVVPSSKPAWPSLMWWFSLCRKPSKIMEHHNFFLKIRVAGFQSLELKA